MAFYSGSRSLRFQPDFLEANIDKVLTIWKLEGPILRLSSMFTFESSQKITCVKTFEGHRKHCLYLISMFPDLKGNSKLNLPRSLLIL